MVRNLVPVILVISYLFDHLPFMQPIFCCPVLYMHALLIIIYLHHPLWSCSLTPCVTTLQPPCVPSLCLVILLGSSPPYPSMMCWTFPNMHTFLIFSGLQHSMPGHPCKWTSSSLCPASDLFAYTSLPKMNTIILCLGSSTPHWISLPYEYASHPTQALTSHTRVPSFAILIPFRLMTTLVEAAHCVNSFLTLLRLQHSVQDRLAHYIPLHSAWALQLTWNCPMCEHPIHSPWALTPHASAIRMPSLCSLTSHALLMPSLPDSFRTEIARKREFYLFLELMLDKCCVIILSSIALNILININFSDFFHSFSNSFPFLAAFCVISWEFSLNLLILHLSLFWFILLIDICYIPMIIFYF